MAAVLWGRKNNFSETREETKGTSEIRRQSVKPKKVEIETPSRQQRSLFEVQKQKRSRSIETKGVKKPVVQALNSRRPAGPKKRALRNLKRVWRLRKKQKGPRG